MYDLMQHLIGVWIGVEQSIIDDGIDQWDSRLHACIRSRGRYREFLPIANSLLNETLVSDFR